MAAFLYLRLVVSSQWSVVTSLWFGVDDLKVGMKYQESLYDLTLGDKMERTNFEKLRVCRLSEKLADELWKIVMGWSYFDRDTVGKQLVRAGDSIGTNIAEGAGRGTFLDNRRFVRMARGSLNETKHWLRRAHKRNLLTMAQTNALKPMLDELVPTLNAYLSSIGATTLKA